MEATIANAQEWLSQKKALGTGTSPDVSTSDSDHALLLLQNIVAVAPPRQDMLSVPLNDIPILTGLVKIILCFGVWTTSPELMLPMLPARTNWKLPPVRPDTQKFEHYVHALTDIVTGNTDIADILRISPLITDILAASVAFPALFRKVRAVVPTYQLYGQLSSVISAGHPRRPVLARSLALLPIERHDAVRAVLEITTKFREQESPDLTGVAAAVPPFTHIPAGIDPGRFSAAVSTQVWVLLTTKTELAPAAARFASLLFTANTYMLQPLLSTIREAFSEADIDAENALIALTRLSEAPGEMFRVLANELIVPLWLLLVSVDALDKPNASTLNLVVKCVNAGAGLKLARATFATEWRGMCWSLTKGTALQINIGRHKNIDASGVENRLDLLIGVLGRSEDITAVVVGLVRLYQRRINFAETARALQKITQAETLRPRMFSDPVQIAQLALELLRPAPKSLSAPSSSLTLADSDDEDDSDEDASESLAMENDSMLELSLSLLSGAIIESSGDSKVIEVARESESDIIRCTKSKNPEVKNKAEFAMQLLSGLRGEVDDDKCPQTPEEALSTARMSLADPAVPSRAYGLHLIGKLVTQHHLSLDDALPMLLHQLHDADSFVYLASIRGIEICAAEFGGSIVLDRLLSYRTDDMDTTLRIHEAITRIVQKTKSLPPQSVQALTSGLINDLRPASQVTYPLRLSAFSILSWIVGEYPHDLQNWQEADIADIACGVLDHEFQDDPLKRGALTLIQTLIIVLSEGAFATLPTTTVHRLIRSATRFVDDDDDVTREHAKHIVRLSEELKAA